MREERPGALSDEEWALVERAVAQLRAGVLATTFGLGGGVGLALATLWLVVRGGDPVGPHLGLLANYFPGYSVTASGAAIGFVYGALTGAVAGGALGWIYNRLAAWRARRRDDG